MHNLGLLGRAYPLFLPVTEKNPENLRLLELWLQPAGWSEGAHAFMKHREASLCLLHRTQIYPQSVGNQVGGQPLWSLAGSQRKALCSPLGLPFIRTDFSFSEILLGHIGDLSV